MERVLPQQIRKSYFGEEQEVVQRLSERKEAQTSLEELTPSAKYVVREARKRLGEQAVEEGAVRPREEDLLKLIHLVEEHEGEELTEKERTAVLAALSASLEHYDILTPLIENPEVNDIICAAYNDISIQSNRENVQTDLAFADHESYKAFVENLLKRAVKACTTATPVVDAAIDPHVRACATHESFSPVGMGPMLTLRIARHRNVSLDQLINYELAPRVLLEYLSTLVSHAKATVLIAGEVGSGKTTLVKALAARIREEEAVLVIEDTHEISLKRKFTRTLLTREANTEGAGRIAPAQAIRTGMRMAMNRVILGEMRDAEAAEAFIDVCASGHAGMSTIHARSARDALSRLELFLSRAQGNVTVETVRKQIANAVSVVVFIDVDKKNQKRRIFEILEVSHSGDGAVQVSPMFSFDKDSSLPHWRRDAGVSEYQQLLQKHQIRLPENGSSVPLDPELLYQTHVVENF